MTVIHLNAATRPAPTRGFRTLGRLLQRLAARVRRPAPRRPAPLPAELADAEPWLLDDLGLVSGRVNAPPALRPTSLRPAPLRSPRSLHVPRAD